MGFVGRFHYGRDVGTEACWGDERQHGQFMKACLNILPIMILCTLVFSAGTQKLAWGSLIKLFSALDIQESQSFFYTLF